MLSSVLAQFAMYIDEVSSRSFITFTKCSVNHLILLVFPFVYHSD